MSMKFNIITFGCKVNAYESVYIKESLLKEKYVYEEDSSLSDIVIVNTCSVTNVADNKCKKAIRSLRNSNPNCLLVVCGCCAENHREELLSLNIDILIGNHDKSKIVTLINDYLKTREKQVKFYDEKNNIFEDMQIESFPLTRAYIKIQDGCNNYCSYCIIPYLRKNIRSKDFNDVLKETKNLVHKGYQEIVFTGINTGAYGKEKGLYDLTDLIHEVSKIDELKRIRLSSIEITEIDDKFINELKNNPKLCAHLHVSLQSGSARILKLMNRKYTKEDYLSKINKLKAARAELNLTTDVIVGFPGETEEEFMECISFCQEVGFSKIHVFPYSPREKTAAVKLPNQLSNDIKKNRARQLIAIDKKLQLEFNKQFLNQTLDVLIEESSAKESIGHTNNFLKVIIKDCLPHNTMQKCQIVEIYPEYVIGKLV